MSTKKHEVTIAEGVSMPLIGVGTWELTDAQCLYNVLDAALGAGYRLIDTAAAYGNERMIGDALKTLLPKYSLKREDIFITSKLKCADQGKKAREAGLRSVSELQTPYVDLYLVHFPGVGGVDVSDPKIPRLREESWLELEKLRDEGKFRAIGVSNYMVPHLEHMHAYATVKPAVNQVEFHPHLTQDALRAFCKQEQIHFQAYSSIGTAHSKEKLLGEPLVNELATKYGCSKTQLLLAWALCQGVSVLPKTTSVAHVVENMRSIDIELTAEDVQRLSALSSNAHYCWDPTNVI